MTSSNLPQQPTYNDQYLYSHRLWPLKGYTLINDHNHWFQNFITALVVAILLLLLLLHSQKHTYTVLGIGHQHLHSGHNHKCCCHRNSLSALILSQCMTHHPRRWNQFLAQKRQNSMQWHLYIIGYK